MRCSNFKPEPRKRSARRTHDGNLAGALKHAPPKDKSGAEPSDFTVACMPAQWRKLATSGRVPAKAELVNSKLTIDEVGAKGGRSKGEKKLAASHANLAKAQAVRREKSRTKTRATLA
jgi:hypothetical protein